MRFTVTSTGDLPALRAQLRAGLVERGVPPDDVDDVVLATHEVAVGALATRSPNHGERHRPTPSLAVRWLVLDIPRREVHVTLRATNLEFRLDTGVDDVRSTVVRAVGGRVDVEPLIGGTIIRLRRSIV